MATSSKAATLTETHRRTQQRTAERAVRTVAASWSPDSALTEHGFDGFLRGAVPVLLGAHEESAGIAGRYFTAFRLAERVTDPFTPPEPGPVTAREIARGLRGFGPAYVWDLIHTRGLTDEAAASQAYRLFVGRAVREILAGGRAYLDRLVSHDPAALGWQRVASNSACAFCAMLAGRGPVYRNSRTAGAGNRYHDFCRCSVEPVFHRDTDLPNSSRRYADLWRESRARSVADFRRALREERAT